MVVDADVALADASVGATVICSSTDTHADLIERARPRAANISSAKSLSISRLERARACARGPSKRAGVVCMIGFQRRFDPTFAAVKARIEAGEIGYAQMLVVTSRDPGAPPVDYIRRSGGIFKDMLIHDFDIFRWILDDEALTVHANGTCLTDPAIADAGDVDSTAVTIRTKRGRLCQINTTRRAAYGYDQRFEVLGSARHAASGQRAADGSRRVHGQCGVERCARGVFPRALSRGVWERDRAHFFDAVDARRKPVRRRSRTASARRRSNSRKRRPVRGVKGA